MMHHTMKYSRLSQYFALVFFCFTVSAEVQAQVETRGASMLGTGGGGPAFVRDNDAITFNPANLLLSDRGARVVLTLGNTSAFSGGDLFQFNYYNDFFTGGRSLTDADVSEVLDGWFGSTEANEQRTAGLYAEFVPLALTVRRDSWAIGVAVRARSFNRVGINRGWLDLVLRGLDENRNIPIDGSFASMATTEVSVALNHRMGRLLVGVAPKVVFGTSYSRGVFTSTASVSDDAVTHDFDYTIRTAGAISRDFFNTFDLFQSDPFSDVSFSNPFGSVAGKGFGVDLGLTYLASQNVLVSVSLTDLGSVSWDTDAQVVTPTNRSFRFEGLELDTGRINDEFDGDVGSYAENVLDSLAREAYDDVNRAPGGFSTSLPTALHFGSAWYFGRLSMNMGLSKALNDAPGNLTQKASFHAGGEYRLGPFPLRAGFRFGGNGALTIGGGIGLRTGVYEFGIAVSASPKSDTMGAGGRYSVALSLVNIHL